MNVELIDHMGTDLSVVNAARVSFDKESEWSTELGEHDILGHVARETLNAGDVRLVNFLARENHWSPFAHTSVSLRVKAPLFVIRQLGKHQVGLSWNEVSRRYVSSTPEFFMPEVWRLKASDIKQGSKEEGVDLDEETFTLGDATDTGTNVLRWFYEDALSLYGQLLDVGVCPEQARMVLPQSMYTEFIWTGSMLAFSRICGLRCKSDTQRETQEIANMISDIVEPLFPVSWEALR